MTQQNVSHRYIAYGLELSSALPLPELLPSDGSAPADVTIERGVVLWAPPAGDHREGYVEARGAQAFIFVEGVGTFAIEAGVRIVVQPAPDASEALLRVFLLGGALGLLLHQRGYLVLHASAVSLGAGALAFVGSSGEGKSTMAAALHHNGHPMLTDDMIALDLSGDAVMLLPGFPRLKLNPAVAAAIGVDPDDLIVFNPEDDRRDWRAAAGFPTAPLPLLGVVELVTCDEVALLQSSNQEAFATLLDNSYAVGLIGASTAAHLRHCAAMAGRVPFFQLERPRMLADLPELAALVARHFCGETQAAPEVEPA